MLAARSLSLVFSVLSVFVAFKIGKDVYNEKVGLLSALLLVFNPLFLSFSTMAKPDVTQIFFTLISLLYCVRLTRRKLDRYYYLAAFFAGLSFGTKYAGIILVPVILYSHVLTYNAASSESWVRKFNGFLRFLFQKKVLYSLLIFGGTFLLTTPYSILAFDEFLWWQDYSRRIWKTGSLGVVFENNPFLWFVHLIGTLGVLIAVISLLGIILVVYSSFKDKENIQIKSITVLVFWVVFYFFFIFLTIGLKHSWALLPIIPVLLIFCANFILFIKDKLSDKGALFDKCGVIVIALVIITSITTAIPYAVAPIKDSRIPSGEWIKENIPLNATILADPFSWVPDEYENWNESWNPLYEELNTTKPDYIVLSSYILRKAPGERYDDYDGFLRENNYTAIKDFSPGVIDRVYIGRPLQDQEDYDYGFGIRSLISIFDSPDSSWNGPEITVYRRDA
ncbi:MAG: glycosyltransferase family 39 protein [Methanomassiliicoccales archaeon]|nr:MAG: glycosyltransferase family 39 protein [Methanomassiliicoccales archaeon]